VSLEGDPVDVHMAIVVVDVADFGASSRTSRDQLVVREGMYEVLTKALADSGIDSRTCAADYRGDSALILVPSDVPKGSLAGQLPGALLNGLRWHNAKHPPLEGIRLRVGLHAGEVHFDSHGAAGPAIIHAFRMLNAPATKEAFHESGGTLALIVSDWFYTEVVRHRSEYDPHLYQRIHIQLNEIDANAWLRLPDSEPTEVAGRTVSVSSESGLPVRIYVSNGAAHHRVESAVLELLKAADLELERHDEPMRGGRLDG
jgi:hypothetical protein